MNRQRLMKLKESGENPVDYVLKYITNQFGGSIALVTSQSVKHFEQNIMNIADNET